jgi:hypothetical protein
MKRPDHLFIISVSPTFRLYSCDKKLAQEKRGLFGFHNYHTCPDCVLEPQGYQFWGCNGHCQGEAPTVESMRFWVGRKAREQWYGKDGSLWGYRFKRGGTIVYRTLVTSAGGIGANIPPPNSRPLYKWSEIGGTVNDGR